jgi:hypothetical protein
VTREQQVRAAIKLLELPLPRRAECQTDIEKALGIMASVSTVHALMKAARSAAYTRALKVYRKRRLQLESAYEALCAITGVGPVPAQNPEPQHYTLYPGAGGRWKQACAVALAYELLMTWWGGDEFVTITRKGSWWRLSAILYGDPAHDLYRHLRAFKPELSPFRGLFQRSEYRPDSK